MMSIRNRIYSFLTTRIMTFEKVKAEFFQPPESRITGLNSASVHPMAEIF